MSVALGGAAVLEGERSAQFSAWVRPHLAAMAALAARLTSYDDRDDIVQEALVRAWRRWSTYDETRGRPLGWLLAITADRARRHRSKPRPVVDDAAVSDHYADVDLERAIRQLSERQRLAVDLYYFVGLDVSTVADVMQCSSGTVKSTLADARRRLRSLLEEKP